MKFLVLFLFGQSNFHSGFCLPTNSEQSTGPHTGSVTSYRTYTDPNGIRRDGDLFGDFGMLNFPNSAFNQNGPISSIGDTVSLSNPIEMFEHNKPSFDLPSSFSFSNEKLPSFPLPPLTNSAPPPPPSMPSQPEPQSYQELMSAYQAPNMAYAPPPPAPMDSYGAPAETYGLPSSYGTPAPEYGVTTAVPHKPKHKKKFTKKTVAILFFASLILVWILFRLVYFREAGVAGIFHKGRSSGSSKAVTWTNSLTEMIKSAWDLEDLAEKVLSLIEDSEIGGLT